MKIIFEGTEEQIKNLKLLVEHGDNNLPEIINDYIKLEQTLKNKELRHNLYTLLGTVHHLCYLTSGQCLIFDKEGKQIGDLQAEFTSGETNIWLLKLVAEHAEKFTLGKFKEWMQEMDKEDFLRVTHLHCA